MGRDLYYYRGSDNLPEVIQFEKAPIHFGAFSNENAKFGKFIIIDRGWINWHFACHHFCHHFFVNSQDIHKGKRDAHKWECTE